MRTDIGAVIRLDAMPQKPKANPTGHAKSALPVPVTAPQAGEVVVPEPPIELCEGALAYWAELWSDGGVAYRRTDRWTIARYAAMRAQHDQINASIGSEWTTLTSKGDLKAHPLLTALHRLDGQLRTLEDRLGLSPESRIRLGLAQAETAQLTTYLESL